MGAGKEPVLSSERYGAHLILDKVVVEPDVRMHQKQRQSLPLSESVLDSLLHGATRQCAVAPGSKVFMKLAHQGG